jgi:hypothetical protein
MTLTETVRRKIAEWRPAGEGRHVFAIPDEGSGWSVAITADRCDDIGCRLWEITLQSSTSAASDAGAALAGWAHRAADRVTGLLEGLKVVEVDPTRNEALLRSDFPAWQGEDVAYYEAILNGVGRATVQRFRGSRQPGQRREQTAFSLTHDALAKLVGDLVRE